jgi:hypothetical protein
MCGQLIFDANNQPVEKPKWLLTNRAYVNIKQKIEVKPIYFSHSSTNFSLFIVQFYLDKIQFSFSTA